MKTIIFFDLINLKIAYWTNLYKSFSLITTNDIFITFAQNIDIFFNCYSCISNQILHNHLLLHKQ